MKMLLRLTLVGALLAVFVFPFRNVFGEDFKSFQKHYGVLKTAAGNGKFDDDDDWEAGMEGGPGVEADLSRPHMAMADKDGNIYIADKESNAIRKVTKDGRIHTIAGDGRQGFSGDGIGTKCALCLPNGLYAKPDGTVYIMDLGNDAIRKLDLKGNLTTLFRDPNGIVMGRGLWVSDKEDLIYYCSNRRIQSWTPKGGIKTLAEDFASLGNLAVDEKGIIFVTDRVGCRVYRVDPDGKKTVIAGNGETSGGGHGKPALETGLDGVRGIALLGNGAYLLATHDGGDIWYVDAKGIIHLFIEGKGTGNLNEGDGKSVSAPGFKISEPRAVTLAPNKDIIITTNDEGYIRVVKRKS